MSIYLGVLTLYVFLLGVRSFYHQVADIVRWFIWRVRS
jgi:hypothetical protein